MANLIIVLLCVLYTVFIDDNNKLVDFLLGANVALLVLRVILNG